MGKHENIKKILSEHVGLELAVLIGSRAIGTNRSDSDWDIAIQWERDIAFWDKLQHIEALRNRLENLLPASNVAVDLIDIPRAGLTMRAEIAENGILLAGINSLAWSYFLCSKLKFSYPLNVA